MKQYFALLDRAAAQVNVFLMVIAIGLGMLDMAVLVSKGMMAAIADNMPTMQGQISGSGYLFAATMRAATRP